MARSLLLMCVGLAAVWLAATGCDGGDGAGADADSVAGADAGGAGGDASPLPDARSGAVDAAPDAALPSPDAAPPQPFTVAFSRPGLDGSPDDTLELALRDLLDLAVPGSTVRVALYHLTRTGMADAFVAAAARGVDVRFVLDDDNAAAGGGLNAATQALVDGLGASKVTFCPDACIGTNINHNKMFLFSELSDGSRDVVVQSSANLTSTQRRLHNNMVIIRDDPALFAAYSGYWQDLRAQVKDSNYYLVVNGTRATKLYAYPRASGDTIVSVLGNVDCTGGGQIHLAMAFFTDARVAVAEALADRSREGCTVRAALRGPDDESPPGAAVLSALAAGGVDVIRYPTGPDGQSIHSKYLLIDSRYAGSTAPRQLVWTGSHNYTGNALHNNDETLLRIEDDGVYAAFLADWTDIASR